jgi:ABC-2 type transport system permease protein
MDIVYYSINIIFYRVLFLHTPNIAGWGENEVMVFVGGFLFIDALVMTFIGNNMWNLPVYINNGDIDYYLTRPVSSLFILSLREFAANSFVNLLMTVGILYWSILQYPHPVHGFRISVYIIMLFMGAFLYYMLRMFTILPVFWTHSGRGFENIFWSMVRFMERPDGIFSGYFRKIITIFLPFAIIASFPVRIFFQEGIEIFLHFTGVIFVLFLILLIAWHYALKAYSSASS